jgi:hypothetical protein
MILIVIFVGFIFGMLYLMAYSFVFVLALGLSPDHPLHWFAYFFCVLAGIYTASQLLGTKQTTTPMPPKISKGPNSTDPSTSDESRDD